MNEPPFPPPDHGAPPSRDWGVSSIVLGLVLPVALPLAMLTTGLALIAYRLLGGSGLSHGDTVILVTVLAGVAAGLVPIPLCGAFFAMKGLRMARVDGAPRALSLTGLLLCAVDVAILVAIAAVLLIVRTAMATGF